MVPKPVVIALASPVSPLLWMKAPYCPPSITSDSSTAGLWFGRNGEMIAVDGAWIKNLSVYYNDTAWDMYDPETGEVYIETGVRGCEITGNPNPPDDLENPSFCLECFISDMPDGAVEQTMLIPVKYRKHKRYFSPSPAVTDELQGSI